MVKGVRRRGLQVEHLSLSCACMLRRSSCSLYASSRFSPWMKVSLIGRGAVAIAFLSSSKRSFVGSTMTFPFTAMSSSVGLHMRCVSTYSRDSLEGTRIELAVWHGFFDVHKLATVFAVAGKRDTQAKPFRLKGVVKNDSRVGHSFDMLA